MRLFCFRLAGHLGMTVRQLLDSLDSAELTEWMAYFNIEPFGPVQEDYRAGVLSAIAFNSVPRERGQTPAKPEDFFPSLKPPPKEQVPQSEADAMDTMKLLAQAMNAK